MSRYRAGSEPANARSPLMLRMILACFGALSCTVLAAISFQRGLGWLGALLLALAIAAVIDVAVVGRHIIDERHGPPRGR